MSAQHKLSTLTISRRDLVCAALAVNASPTFISFFSSPSFEQRNRGDFPTRMLRLNVEFNAMVGHYWAAIGPQQDLGESSNPYAIGAKRSFVPVLGELIWKLPENLAPHVPFSACIYKVSDGRPIGYVRMPQYNYDESAVNEFTKLVAHLETATEALVFDQVNNPGGSMFQMYAILSCLTDRALSLPQHQLALNDEDAAKATRDVALAEAGDAVPPDERPSPELVAYSRFVLSEIKAGRKRLTNPGYLAGIAKVLPAKNHYTKKIIVLINELDFSAAEFLAAILQDNKRATLFGRRTAGAGGCVRPVTLPNSAAQFGIRSISITWTIARRTNGQMIENIGIHPDVNSLKRLKIFDMATPVTVKRFWIQSALRANRVDARGSFR